MNEKSTELTEFEKKLLVHQISTGQTTHNDPNVQSRLNSAMAWKPSQEAKEEAVKAELNKLIEEGKI